MRLASSKRCDEHPDGQKDANNDRRLEGTEVEHVPSIALREPAPMSRSALSKHPDEHRSQRSVLLAEDDEASIAERVDEKLTARRDTSSARGIWGTQETAADLRFWGSEPVTSGFGGRSNLPDAEEVRGSILLRPRKPLFNAPFVHR